MPTEGLGKPKKSARHTIEEYHAVKLKWASFVLRKQKQVGKEKKKATVGKRGSSGYLAQPMESHKRSKLL